MHNVLIWSQSWKVIKLWINYNFKISLGKWHRKNKQKLSNAQRSRCLRLKVSFFRIQPSTNNLGSQAAEWKTLKTTWAVSGICSCSVFTVCPVDRSANSDTGALARWTNTCYLWMNDLNNKLLITRRPLHFNILSGNVSCTDILASLPNIFGAWKQSAGPKISFMVLPLNL